MTIIRFNSEESAAIRARAAEIHEQVSEVGWYGHNSLPAVRRGLSGEVAVQHFLGETCTVENFRSIYGPDLRVNGQVEEVKECASKWRGIRGGFPVEERHGRKYFARQVRRVWFVEELTGWRDGDDISVKIFGWMRPSWILNCSLEADSISDKEGKRDFIVREVDLRDPSSPL